MMTEISLNILDIAENSVKAKASLVEIGVIADHAENKLTVTIKDNGCGMDETQVANVIDPFYTTRTTRKVGLGVPFFKESAEQAGGGFSLTSKLGVGTTVTVWYRLDHIDRMPMGDLTSTLHTLITMHDDIDFLVTYKIDEAEIKIDTREFREILGDISFREPEISQYLKEYLTENIASVGTDI